MNDTIRILVLEDNEDDYFLLQKILSRSEMNFSSDLVTTKADFIGAINANSYNIILLDFQLEQFNCIEAVQLCRTARINTPVILVSGMVTEKIAESLGALGITEFILKDNLKDLPSKIIEVLKNENN